MRISRETMFMEIAELVSMIEAKRRELVPDIQWKYDVLVSLRSSCGYAA